MGKKYLLQDFSESLAGRSTVPKKRAEVLIRLVFDVIEEALIRDSIVKIKGFGTFKMISVERRESVDVNTGERIEISGHSKISFIPDNNLKEQINKPFAHFQTVVLNDDTDTETMELIVTENNEAEDVGSIPEQDELPIKNLSDTIPVKEEKDTEEEKNDLSENVEKIEIKEEIVTEAKVDNVGQEHKELDEKESPDTTEDVKVLKEMQDVPKEKHTDNSSHNTTLHDVVVPPISIHMPEEGKKKTNWWKRTVLFLLILFLMFLSYFAGYFRLFCPCESWLWMEWLGSKTEQSVIETPSSPIKVKSKDTVNVRIVDKIAVDTLKTVPVAVEEDYKTKYPQVESGKYWITGTKVVRKVLFGETLRSIAQDEYGKKGNVVYIITYNQIKDPNNIVEGTILKIPTLLPKGK